MALSSITRTALALRTKVDAPAKSTFFMRESGLRFEVVENVPGGGEKVIFSSGSRDIARRRLDREIDGE